MAYPQDTKTTSPPMFAEKKEPTWQDNVETLFGAIGAGGLAGIDATQNTTFYKDYMARQQKEADKQAALEKEDRDMQRRAWELEQQQTNDMAKIKLEKADLDKKQAQTEATNLTSAILESTGTAKTVEEIQGSLGSLARRREAVVENPNLSDTEKATHLVRLNAQEKVLTQQVRPLITQRSVDSAMQGDSDADGNAMGVHTIIDAYRGGSQQVRDDLEGTNAVETMLTNLDAVIPTLRAADAAGIELKDANGNVIDTRGLLVDGNVGARTLITGGKELDSKFVADLAALDVGKLEDGITMANKVAGLAGEREGAAAMLSNLETETYGMDRDRLETALNRYYSAENLVIRDGEAVFMAQGGDIFAPAIVEMKTFIQNATKEQLWSLGKRLTQETLKLPGMEGELNEVRIQAQERLGDMMAAATPIEKNDFFMEMTAEQEGEITTTIADSATAQNTTLRSYLGAVGWTAEQIQELEEYSKTTKEFASTGVRGSGGGHSVTSTEVFGGLDSPVYLLKDNSATSILDKFAKNNGLPSAVEMIQAVGTQQQIKQDELSLKLFESYMHKQEVTDIEKSIETLTEEIVKNDAAGVDTTAQKVRLEQMDTMRDFRASGKEGSAHVAVRSALHQALDSVIDGEKLDADEKADKFEEVVKEVFGLQKDNITPITLRNLKEYFSTDAPFEKQILLALENNAAALLPALVVASDKVEMKNNTMVFNSAIEDLRSLIRLSNTISSENRGSDYAQAAGEAPFEGDEEATRLNTLSTTLTLIKNHRANQ